MFEIWKPVEGYEGYYSVSNLGRVRREEHTDKCGHTYKQRILADALASKLGYRHVHLSKEGIAKWHSVHRLVANAFVEKKDGCDVVNHIDNNPSNNKANNLEWTTYAGNMQHAARQGRMVGKPENFKKAQEARKAPVIATDCSGNEYWFASQTDAAKQLGIRSNHIGTACRKEYGYKTVGGYSFRYVDDERQKQAIPKKVGMTKAEHAEHTRRRMLGNKYGLGHSPSERCKEINRAMRSIEVCQYAKDGTFIAKYPSSAEAKRVTGISHIDDASAGKRKTAGGFIWRRSKDV